MCMQITQICARANNDIDALAERSTPIDSTNRGENAERSYSAQPTLDLVHTTLSTFPNGNNLNATQDDPKKAPN